MYTILCVIELLKAACPSTLPLKNGGDTRESNRAFDVENILSFPNIDDIAVKVKEYIRALRMPTYIFSVISLINMYCKGLLFAKLVALVGNAPASPD